MAGAAEVFGSVGIVVIRAGGDASVIFDEFEFVVGTIIALVIDKSQVVLAGGYTDKVDNIWDNICSGCRTAVDASSKSRLI